MSRTFAPYSIIAALLETEKIIGLGREWSSVNEIQRQFLAQCFMRGQGDIRDQKMTEIVSKASLSVVEINEFLKSRGYDIQLREDAGDSFAVASILDLLVRWLEAGREYNIYANNEHGAKQNYPGVKMSKGFKVYEIDKFYVLDLLTQDENHVYITELASVPDDDFELLAEVLRLQGLIEQTVGSLSFPSVAFPMVDLDQRPDVSWLLRLWTRGQDDSPYYVSQALVQNRLRVNEVGARAQSAAAIAMRRGGFVDDTLICDCPFVIWFARKGLSLPIFVGFITQEDWKKPESL